MSNSLKMFIKKIRNDCVVKCLWGKYLWGEKRWLINIFVGGIAAIYKPVSLPQEVSSGMNSAIIHALAFIVITEIVKSFLMIPSQVKKELSEHKDEIATTYYKGFYTLLTDLSKNFEQLENQFRIVTSGDSPLRGVLLDFITRSLASIGKNGFTMIDASVDIYVRYIVEILQKATDVRMTCIVRPYWFVTDEIQGVTLPPYKTEKDKYGKGEHLIVRKGNSMYQRLLIIDEDLLSEMLLTVYIDMHFNNNNNNNNITKNCPLCLMKKEDTEFRCPFHDDRIEDKNIDDIPEIFWFKKEVNKGTNLIYTLVSVEKRKSHKELDDRVYVEEEPKLDIRFSFSNLESGTMRITWGANAQGLARINDPDRKINLITGADDLINGDKCYNVFNSITFNSCVKTTMIPRLKLLKTSIRRIKKNWFDSVSNIGGQDASEIKKLLANGDTNFCKGIIKAIEKLIEDLNDKNINAIYKEIVEFYKKKGIPKVAYIITNDPLHPEYPIRVARWKLNWDGDGKPKKGIKNVQKK